MQLQINILTDVITAVSAMLQQYASSGNVQLYAIIYGDCKHAYVGSSISPIARFKAHANKINKVDNYKYRAWRKYGIHSLCIFNVHVSEAMRLQAEQAVYDWFALHNYILTNAAPIKSRCKNYEFAARAEYRQHVSIGLKRLIQQMRQSGRLASSIARMHTASATAKRAKSYSKTLQHQRELYGKSIMSDVVKLEWQRHRDVFVTSIKRSMSKAETRQRISMSCKSAAKRQSVKAHKSAENSRRWKDANYKRMTAKSISKALLTRSTFMQKYNASYAGPNVFHYEQPVGRFMPWMNFIIQKSNNVIVFIWDTREVLFQCDARYLPPGYVKAYDSYADLKFTA